MNVDYDKLLNWLQERQHVEGKSAREWGEMYPSCEQAIWRSGMWYAYHDVARELHRFVTDPEITVSYGTLPTNK